MDVRSNYWGPEIDQRGWFMRWMERSIVAPQRSEVPIAGLKRRPWNGLRAEVTKASVHVYD